MQTSGLLNLAMVHQNAIKLPLYTATRGKRRPWYENLYNPCDICATFIKQRSLLILFPTYNGEDKKERAVGVK